ncbi:MAG TPA: putative inorganic carbon transporter subunit DabA, partial [Microcella sp.]|nr:putative inorganic carbon transporter subunit DabA [Microcella sp.]
MTSHPTHPTEGRGDAVLGAPSAVTGPSTIDLQRVRAFADVALDVVGDYYGLDAAVAVNPLLPRLAAGFGVAATEAAATLGARGAPTEAQFRARLHSGSIRRADLAAALRRRGVPGTSTTRASSDALVDQFLAEAPRPVAAPPVDRRTARVDDRFSRFARSWFADEEAGWSVRTGAGFYRDWRALAMVDPTLRPRARRALRELPERADALLARHLAGRRLTDTAALELLGRHLARTPGWTAALRRRTTTRRDVDAVEFLAVRLALTTVLGAPDPAAAAEPELTPDRLLVWQEAAEAATHTAILRSVRVPTPSVPDAGEAGISPAAPDTVPEAAHVVCCIDVRSEGLRRHLEAVGPYGTSGFAGFFGVAARVRPLGAAMGVDACPVLISPRHAIDERPRPGAAPRARAALDSLRSAATWKTSLRAPEKGVHSALGWAELSGWMLGPLSALRSVAPGALGDARRPDDLPSAPPTLFDLDSAMSIDEQVMTAETVLTTMGMTTRFAPVVLLLGHGATTTNAPFRTALDCGACGGHRGGASARIAAALLNAPAVRTGLAARGITIPDETVFVGGEHDTVTDRVTVHDTAALPDAQRLRVRALEADLAIAGKRLRRERLAELPGGRRAGAEAEVDRRAADWAQVFPEWGLARNAAIIIGPRSLTRGVDLERRAFLHSYDPSTDPDGTALTTILTAPLVVAHWINAQYYFSSVDPDVFGAGSKTVHNLV